MIETRRDPGLLHALNIATHLLRAKLLDRSNQERIEAVLDIINIETSYTVGIRSSAEERTLTLVRAAAVRFAGELKCAGTTNPDMEQLLLMASEDPMPEVRFAVGSPPE